jgi:hypothetical protein
MATFAMIDFIPSATRLASSSTNKSSVGEKGLSHTNSQEAAHSAKAITGSCRSEKMPQTVQRPMSDKKQCEECRKQFKPKQPQQWFQKFCSPACRLKAWRKRKATK